MVKHHPFGDGVAIVEFVADQNGVAGHDGVADVKADGAHDRGGFSEEA